MKKIFLTFSFLFFFGNLALFSQTIQVKNSIIDYGEIKKGADSKRIFLLQNIGKKPLIITNVETSCGCTVAEKPKLPILPQKSYKLEVSYDTQRVGSFEKAITVESNSLKNSRVVLIIKGTVKDTAK